MIRSAVKLMFLVRKLAVSGTETNFTGIVRRALHSRPLPRQALAFPKDVLLGPSSRSVGVTLFQPGKTAVSATGAIDAPAFALKTLTPGGAIVVGSLVP